MVFWLMILAHFVADFTLQGLLIDLKQVSWWRKMVPDLNRTKYANDYLCALFCHSFYWAIAVCLPLKLCGISDVRLSACIIANALFHALVDNSKANRLSINLWTDQLWHLAQIVATYQVIA